MAVTTIKSTYSLDVETVRTLESLARRWNVSKSEVLRRAIRAAAGENSRRAGERSPRAGELSPRAREKMEAWRKLQAYVKARDIDVEAWAREVRATRDAAGRKRMSARDDPS